MFARRSVIRPADPMLYIIPQDRPLVINARVDPIDIDKLTIGQDVKLHFSALDQRETPELTAIVELISVDAFQEENTGYQASLERAELKDDGRQPFSAYWTTPPFNNLWLNGKVSAHAEEMRGLASQIHAVCQHC